MLPNYRVLILRTSLFFSVLTLFLMGLKTQEVISFDSRFYLFAREMLQLGGSWFPTTYRLPYPDYLSTSTWLISFVAILYGELNKMTAVLPTALVSALTVVLTYNLGARFDRRWGAIAVAMLLMTLPFLKGARSITLDMYTTFIATCTFTLLISSSAQLVGLVALLLLGFAFRGPIGFIVPAGIVCTYYWLEKNYKDLFQVSLLALFLLLLCIAFLVMVAYQTGNLAFTHDVLDMQIFGRIEHRYFPWYFYFTTGLANFGISLFLAFLTAIGLWFSREWDEHEKFIMQLVGWMLVVLLGLSVPGIKKIRYILPMAPAAALLAAYVFVAPAKQIYFQCIRRFTLFLFTIVPTLVFIALTVATYILPTLPNIIGLQIFCISMQIVIVLFRQQTTLVMSTMLFVLVLNYFLIEPFELLHDKSHDFVVKVETIRMKKNAVLAFFREKPDNLPIKYEANMPILQTPVFISDEMIMARLAFPTVIVSSVENITPMLPDRFGHYHMIAEGKLGHVRVYAFANYNVKDDLS